MALQSLLGLDILQLVWCMPEKLPGDGATSSHSRRSRTGRKVPCGVQVHCEGRHHYHWFNQLCLDLSRIMSYEGTMLACASDSAPRIIVVAWHQF
jgi:hypothetical protein